MASVNKVILVGNLGRDPETRFAPSGSAICNITLATSRNWKDKSSGEKREETEWHRVVFYDKLAEIAGEYLKKGRPVYVEGRLKTRKWTDKDGAEKYTTEIIAAERKDKMRPIFRGAIALLVVVQVGLLVAGQGLWTLALWLLLFFVAFNVLEATLPSLVSRTAPPNRKGLALGIYNTGQSLGLFAGGAVGGLLAQYATKEGVFLVAAALAALWLIVAVTIQPPPKRHKPAEAEAAPVQAQNA